MTSKLHSRQKIRTGTSADIPSEAEFKFLARQPIAALRMIWSNRLGTEPPAIRSREVMVQLLAWRLQEKAFGGLEVASERKLREIAIALDRDGTYEPQQRRDLSFGVIVTREWKGVTHRVAATPNGFEYDGRNFRSLSDVARTITGTRWSGPRFFGLEQRRARSSRKSIR